MLSKLSYFTWKWEKKRTQLNYIFKRSPWPPFQCWLYNYFESSLVNASYFNIENGGRGSEPCYASFPTVSATCIFYFAAGDLRKYEFVKQFWQHILTSSVWMWHFIWKYRFGLFPPNYYQKVEKCRDTIFECEMILRRDVYVSIWSNTNVTFNAHFIAENHQFLQKLWFGALFYNAHAYIFVIRVIFFWWC